MADRRKQPAAGRGRTFLDRLRLRRAGFRQNESGQALLATGILSLALLMFAVSIMPAGEAVQRRIRLQTAADAAAMSAGTWLARGGNMIQAGNGFQYDIHTLAMLVVEIVTYVYIAKMIKDVVEICSGDILAAVELITDWFEGIDKISRTNRYCGYAREASTIPLQTMHPGYGMMAMAESSATARLNGATIIDSDEALKDLFGAFGMTPPDSYEKMHGNTTKWLASGETLSRWWDAIVGIVGGIPIIGEWIAEAIEDLVDTDTDFDQYAWTLSPSHDPKTAFAFTEMTSFKEWGETPEGLFSPLKCHFYWPFAEAMLFLQFIDWDTEYVRLASELEGGSKSHKETTYTLAVRSAPDSAYYSKLPLMAHWFGEEPEREVAVASVRLYDDRLTDAGCKDSARWFVSTPIFALPIWPLPLVRMFYGYGGDFKVEQTPVAFQNGYGAAVTKGTDLLIYH
jgi:hypothetical protein